MGREFRHCATGWFFTGCMITWWSSAGGWKGSGFNMIAPCQGWLRGRAQTDPSFSVSSPCEATSRARKLTWQHRAPRDPGRKLSVLFKVGSELKNETSFALKVVTVQPRFKRRGSIQWEEWQRIYGHLKIMFWILHRYCAPMSVTTA